MPLAMGAVKMEPIKIYYNCCCYDYREGAIGGMVTFEDHQSFVQKVMTQAFRDGVRHERQRINMAIPQTSK